MSSSEQWAVPSNGNVGPGAPDNFETSDGRRGQPMANTVRETSAPTPAGDARALL